MRLPLPAALAFTAILLAGHAASAHPADTDGDSWVNMTELLDFIELWYGDSIAADITEVASAIGLWKDPLTCSGLGGTVCSPGQSCSGSWVEAPNTGRCCRGQCKRHAEFYPVDAILDESEAITPLTDPIDAEQGDALSIRACRGEYEPASFVIQAKEDLDGVMIEATDLESGDYIIPKGNIDIKLVKSWYQSGTDKLFEEGDKILIPELLINDDELVKVDYQNKRNWLRVERDGGYEYTDVSDPDAVFPDGVVIEDSGALKPFDLPEGRNRQVWVLAKIPDNTPTGLYRGSIIIDMGDGYSARLGFDIEVLPFDLEPPILEYGIYYTGKLYSGDDKEEFHSTWKSPEQYRVEIENMKEHGVVYPMFQQTRRSLFRDELDLREEVDLPKDSIYLLGCRRWAADGTIDVELTRQAAIDWSGIAHEYGYDGDVYCYGIGERKCDEDDKSLEDLIPVFKAVHDSGCKNFAACYSDAPDCCSGDDCIGELLDKPILNANPRFDEVEIENAIDKFHEYGQEVFMYANPQGGLEQPLMNRRNFGFWLWNMGYEGAFTWSYQCSFGHIWNDWDGEPINGKLHRPRAYAYPVTNGVIDTIQWEAFREGVDDIRYLSTLLKANSHEAGWVSDMFSQGRDPQEIRDAIIDKLLYSLVAHYSFDEGSGSVAFDSSHFGNHGSIDGATRVEGKSGNALMFDGNDDKIYIENSNGVAVTGAITVEAWVKPKIGRTFNGILSKGRRAGCGYSCEDYRLLVAGDVALFGFSDATSPAQEVSSSTELESDTWYHIAGTWDGTTRDGGIRIYINGELDNTATSTKTSITDRYDLVIGGGTNDDSHADRRFRGTLDEVKIYSRALTAEEIREEYLSYS